MYKFWKTLIKWNSFLEVIMLLFLSLTPLLWVGNGWVIFGHDSGFRPNVAHHLTAVWNGWYSTVNTGIDWSLYKGFLMIQLPELVFQFLLGSLESAQLFVLPFWFFVMAFGMYVAIRGFFSEKKYWFLRMYASFFWVFNFYVLQAWGIAERAKFSLYAALPISILLISKMFEKKISIPVGAVLFGLLYFFCNGGGSPPLFGASVVVWGVTSLVWSVWLCKNEGWKSIGRGGLIFASCITAFILFNFYWLFVEAELYRGTYMNVVASEGGIEGLLRWEQVISKNASLTNLLRLQGMPDWYDNPNHPFSNIFRTNPILIILSYIPIIVILFGSIAFRKRLQQTREWLLIVLLGILLLTGLFFSSGSHPPTGFLYILFMKYIPGFAVFRSSFFKFAPVLWFSIIVLSGYFLQHFLLLFRTNTKNILSSIILFGILFYHFPFFHPTFFQFDPRFSTRIQIPQYVKNIGRFLDTNGNDGGRVLLLPELDRGYINEPVDSYTWGFYSLDVLPRLVSRRSIIGNDASSEIVQSLYESLYGSNWDKFFVLVKTLGISQILYREDERISTTKPARWITKQTLQNQFGEPIYSQNQWSVFRVGQNVEAIQIHNSFMALSGKIDHDSMLLTHGAVAPVVRLSWADINLLANPVFAVEAECLLCAEDEHRLYTESIILPSVRFLPESPLYPLLGERKIPKPSHELSHQQLIDVYLSRSMIRLSEYRKLAEAGKTNDLVITDYQASLQHISENFQNLKGRDRIIYANRLWSFMLKQGEALSALPNGTPQQFVDLKNEIQSQLWISDAAAYRFIVDVPTRAQFTPLIDPTSSFYFIDNKRQYINTVVELAEGVHRIEIPKQSSRSLPPKVFFTTRVDSTPIQNQIPSFSIVSQIPTKTVISVEKASLPYLLLLPFTYDNRWKATVTRGKAQAIQHVLVNGYANGWFIKTDDAVDITVSYTLETAFRKGLLVSGVSLMTGIILLLGSYRWRTKKNNL